MIREDTKPAVTAPTFVTVAPVTVNETDGTATVTFTRALAGPAATVTFTVTGGTATPGSDYTDPASFTANFAAGSTTATVSIPIANDALVEATGRREAALADAEAEARRKAVAAGAVADTVVVTESEDVPLAYLRGNATRIRIKVVGEMGT